MTKNEKAMVVELLQAAENLVGVREEVEKLQVAIENVNSMIGRKSCIAHGCKFTWIEEGK